MALVVSAALYFPVPWLDVLPPQGTAFVESVRSWGTPLRWGLACLGLAHLLSAAFAWSWETWEEGGLVAWLSPVVLLAPLLVFLTVGLLLALGRDVMGPEGIGLTIAVRDAVLFWGLLSLYGLFYLVTSWEAMRRHAISAVIGYVLCGPMLLAGWEQVRIDAHGVKCRARLSMVATGIRQYAEAYGQLPPPAVLDDTGAPLLSWRVLILPFVGEQPLYDRFRLNEAWDSPHNAELLSQRPDMFRCDEVRWDDTALTLVQAVVGEETLFSPRGGVDSAQLRGRSGETVMLVEVNHALGVPWSAPHDLVFDKLRPDSLLSNHRERHLAVTAEGKPDELQPPNNFDGSPLPAWSRFVRPSAGGGR